MLATTKTGETDKGLSAQGGLYEEDNPDRGQAGLREMAGTNVSPCWLS